MVGQVDEGMTQRFSRGHTFPVEMIKDVRLVDDTCILLKRESVEYDCVMLACKFRFRECFRHAL